MAQTRQTGKATKQDHQLMDELMVAYEELEDAYESARRRCDWKAAEQYKSLMDNLAPRIWPWMQEA